MLGFAIPVGKDAPEALRAFLVASRDHEGETSEKIIAAAYGKGAEEQKAEQSKQDHAPAALAVLAGAETEPDLVAQQEEEAAERADHAFCSAVS